MLDAPYDRSRRNSQRCLSDRRRTRAPDMRTRSRSPLIRALQDCAFAALYGQLPVSPGCADYMSRGDRAATAWSAADGWEPASLPLPPARWTRVRSRSRLSTRRRYADHHGTPRSSRDHALVSGPVPVSALRDAAAADAAGELPTRSDARNRCDGARRDAGSCHGDRQPTAAPRLRPGTAAPAHPLPRRSRARGRRDRSERPRDRRRDDEGARRVYESRRPLRALGAEGVTGTTHGEPLDLVPGGAGDDTASRSRCASTTRRHARASTTRSIASR